jgi:hypothetical protein
MDPYIDDENKEENISKLKSCKSLDEIRELIGQIFPKWIKGFYTTYSQDYPSLIFGYVSYCKLLKTTPKGIILVDFIPTEEEAKDPNCKYTVLLKYLDTMTVNGFCVRRSIEFFPCTCQALIPSKNVYSNLAFTKPDSVPKNWSNKCTKCVEEIYD